MKPSQPQAKPNNQAPVNDGIQHSFNRSSQQDPNNIGGESNRQRTAANHHVEPNLEHDPEVLQALSKLIASLGENPDREGLADSPARFIKAWQSMLSGYGQSAQQHLQASFSEQAQYNGPVIMKNIAFFSHCEHHLLPFFGTIHVAYLPKNRVVGLSKVARVVETFAKRLQTQERLTAQIAQAIDQHLSTDGCIVQATARHSCMEARGVCRLGTTTQTLQAYGQYQQDKDLREEFFKQVQSQ